MFTEHLFLQIQQIWLSVQAWTLAPSETIVTMNINAPLTIFSINKYTVHATLLI